MKRTILLLSFLFAIFFSMNAQSYKSAVGLRFGYPTSVSYKHFLNDSNALEVSAGARFFSFYRWVNVSVAYQFYNPLDLDIDGLEGLQWYFGFGGSAYLWNYDDSLPNPGRNLSFGVQGYLGLDYAFDDIPLNLSIDWVPSLFLNGFSSGLRGGYGALSARYILNQ